MNSTQHHIVFIDGICVLCNQLSKILIRLDKKNSFYSQHLKALMQRIYSLTKRRFNFGFQSKRDDLCQKQSNFIYHSSASLCEMDCPNDTNHPEIYSRFFI